MAGQLTGNVGRILSALDLHEVGGGPSDLGTGTCTGQPLLLAFPAQGLDKKRTLALAFSPVSLQLFPLLLLTLGSGCPVCKGQQLLVPSGLLG